MATRTLPLIAACLVLALPVSPAFSHTSVASTVPKTGSVLAESPPVIEIKFREAARLTSVTVVEAGKSERKLEFTPVGSATSFKISDPKLASGRNEIQWKALSADGHVVSGSLILTIDASAKTH